MQSGCCFWCPTWRRMSLDRLVTPPQISRASAHRAYEVLVLKTSRSDSAKLVRLKGALFSMLTPGNCAGRIPTCIRQANDPHVDEVPYTCEGVLICSTSRLFTLLCQQNTLLQQTRQGTRVKRDCMFGHIHLSCKTLQPIGYAHAQTFR